MTKKLFSILTILILNIFGAYAQSSVGLVAHWAFNGNANDTSGNAHHGTMHNVTAVAGINGAPGTAMQFAGDTTSYITVPNSTAFDVDSFSICALLKATGFYTDLCQASVVLNRGAGGSGHYNLELTDVAFDSSCTVTGDTSHFVFHSEANNAPYKFKPIQYLPTIRTNQWYSVVTTFKGDTLKVYVNGTLMSSAASNSTGPIGIGAQGIAIGNSPWAATTYPYWFKGVIDDLRLYNRVLTPAEASQYSLLGVEDKHQSKIDVSLSPNPGSGKFVLSGNVNINSAINLEVYNTVGQIVYKKTTTSNNGILSEKLELNDVPNGLYIVRINAGEESKSIRFSLQR